MIRNLINLSPGETVVILFEALDPRSGGKDLKATGQYPPAFGHRVAFLHHEWMELDLVAGMRHGTLYVHASYCLYPSMWIRLTPCLAQETAKGPAGNGQPEHWLDPMLILKAGYQDRP